MQTELIKTAEEKKEAILKAVNELQGAADANQFVSVLDDVLIDWLSSTETDKEYRGMIHSYFFALKIFFNDLEMVED